MPTSGAKQYSVQRITVPALGTVSIRYDYQPDQIVFVPEICLTNRMDVFLDGVQGSSAFPLYAMGPLSLMGAANPQTVRLVSYDSSIRYIRVAAHKGYPQIVITPPTTLVIPESAYPQAQTRYEILYLPNIGSPISFLHNHVGSDIVAMVSASENSTGLDGDIVGVTIGGVAANLLGKAHVWGGGVLASSVLGWYLRANVPEGNVQVSTAFTTATEDVFYGMVFSYAAGIRMGNITTQSYYGAAPPLFSVIGQEIGSVVMCGAHAASTVGAVNLTDTSGAPVFDPVHTMGTVTVGVGMWRRAGTGTQSFDLAVTSNSAVAAAALEVLPRI